VSQNSEPSVAGGVEVRCTDDGVHSVGCFPFNVRSAAESAEQGMNCTVEVPEIRAATITSSTYSVDHESRTFEG
jgi:uncharacterized protein (UPF0147 family)